MTHRGPLRVDGTRIVAGDTPVILRGFGLGGWMNMESVITRYAGSEAPQRRALRRVWGDEGHERLFADEFPKGLATLLRRAAD